MSALRTSVAALLAAATLASGCSTDPGRAPTGARESRTVPPQVDEPARRVLAPPPVRLRPRVTRVLVTGDVMLGRRVARPGADPVRPLRFLAPRLRSADIAVGTLESTLTDDGPPQQGGDSFAAPPGSLAGLERVGFDVLSLANNHTGDFGTPALLATVDAFAGSGVRPVGAGRDLAAASRPVVLRRQGVDFGFVAFNAIGETPRATPGFPGALSVRMPPRTGPLRPADLRHVTGVVRRLASRVDVVVVLPHWGTQYTHRPEPVQSRVGQALVRAGADLVVGGHPHWVQGLEPVGEAVVAHSLGNLVFDMDFMEQTMEGVTLTATFRGDRLAGIDLDPYRMGADFAPRPVTGAAAERILADVRAHSRGRFRGP